MNDTFSFYAFNQTRLDNIVDTVCENYINTGQVDFTFEDGYNFTKSDRNYIRRKVKEKLENS